MSVSQRESQLETHLDPSGARTNGAEPARPRDLIGATVWTEGAEPVDLDDRHAPDAGVIRWFDVRGDGDVDALFGYLAPRCLGLTREMVEDLLEPDRRPQGERWGDGELRLASTFAVYPTETKNGRGDWACPVPSADLLYQPVELISNGDWLLTCWHPTEVYCGWNRLGEPGVPKGHADVRRGVTKRWCGKSEVTAADLGVLVMHELALTYAPAHRQLYAALEEWELGLYGDVKGDLTKIKTDSKTPRDLWSARARLSDWLNPLNIPGLREDLDKAWLPATDHAEVKKVDDRVDKALSALARLGESLRSSFHSLQLLAAESQRDRNEQRQRRIERLATMFLIPTLVVGFYGANTWVPGQQQHWGLWVMVAAIGLFTALGISGVNVLHSRDDLRMPRLRWRDRSERDSRKDPA
jgi:Mg2+ and Co2+ transporter CorA